jgi:murein L,D-transpeptidase YcbB/YkuD
VDKDWRIARPALDLARLKQDLEAGAMPSALLASLLPQTPEYNLLRQQLALVSAEPPGKERDDKLLRIRANLERLRWLPRILPAARVEVRIPAYRLDLYRGARVVSHDVIVGARRTPSPTFAAEIQSVTLNPVWDPPASIERELISRFRRNRAAAVRERFEGVLPNGQIVDAAQINWNAKPFVYDIRQRPGPANALGLIRFNLPNPYAVYLHDTPSRALFDREKRALSHGCIRVRDPMALAIALLDSAEWDEASLAAAAKPGETVVVSLPTSIPVYILYMTTDINDGAITYYGDVYRRDQVIVDALDKAQTAS